MQSLHELGELIVWSENQKRSNRIENPPTSKDVGTAPLSQVQFDPIASRKSESLLNERIQVMHQSKSKGILSEPKLDENTFLNSSKLIVPDESLIRDDLSHM